MTAQASDLIRYQGEMESLCTEPLRPYLEREGIKFEPLIVMTSNWRGYVSTWEIADNRLYLTSIGGSTRGGRLSLSSLFPAHPRFLLSRRTKPVFADWYTGTLRIPRGKQLECVHTSYGGVYAEDVLITVEKGIVTGAEVRKNDETTDYVWDESISGMRHAKATDWPWSERFIRTGSPGA